MEIMDYFSKLGEYFSNDMAIDLGTANTLVCNRGGGIILNEPSVVAVKRNPDGSSSEVVAVGLEARKMLGRAPGNISVIRPIKDGVIADFEVTGTMLKYFIAKASVQRKSLVRPRIIICVPYGVTQVEKRAVKEAAHSAGAREVFLVEEPMAAAIGAGLPITEPRGNVVVEIGGGTCGVAVISLGGIVHCKSIRVAGDKFDEDIVSYVRRHCNLLIGERTAEEIKLKIGSAYPSDDDQTMLVKGREVASGVLRVVEISGNQVCEALKDSLEEIIKAISITLEKTPPELASDIVDTGIVLTGGGALLKNLDILIRERTGTPAIIAQNPLLCVAVGSGKILENIDTLKTLTTQ